MTRRILVIRRGCSNCNETQAERIINMLNLNLPIEKQIRIFDAFEWEDFGVELDPILRGLERKTTRYPFLEIDGIEVELSLLPEINKRALKEFLNEDFII